MRVAILGAGRMGTGHAKSFQNIDGVDVAAIVGRMAEKVDAVASDLGVDGFTDPDRVLDDATVDAVVVAVPSDKHATYVERALEASKHVFCETPMTLSLEDADTIVQAAASSDTVAGVALLMRFVADYEYIYGELSAGKLGAPVSAVGVRLSPPYTSGDDNHYGDPLIEVMLFELDVLVRFFDEPISLTGSSPDPEGLSHVFATLNWPDFHASLEATNRVPTSHPFTTGFRLICEDETIESRFTMRDGEFGGGLTRYPRAGDPEPVQVGHDPYLRECEYFVRCVRGEADPALISVDEARKSIALSHRIRESINSNGERIDLR